MSVILRTILIVWLALLLMAFSSTSRGGRKFDAVAADQIKIGTSTESDVIELLGAPLKTRINSDGTKKYGYAHVESSITATPFSGRTKIVSDKLVIDFDKRGVVTNIERTKMD